MSTQGGVCWSCGRELAATDYGRGDTCIQCRRDTKVCKNCIHFDPDYHNQCRENQADRVLEKERSNFCDYFKASSQTHKGGQNQKQLDARAAAEALFKKKS